MALRRLTKLVPPVVVSAVFIATSLVLCTLVGWLWYRSHRGPDVLHYTSSRQWSMSVISGHGTLDVMYLHHWPQDPEFRVTRYDPLVYYGTRYSKRILGFGADVAPSGGKYVNVPHWFLFALAAAPAASVGWRRRRWRPEPGVNRCAACGYDLRATPDRCPECGAAAVISRGGAAVATAHALAGGAGGER